MATAKKEYVCRWCQKPLSGYQVWKRHERECPLNPTNAEPVDAPVEASPVVRPDIGLLRDVVEETPKTGPAIEPDTELPPDSLAGMVALEVAKHLMIYEQRVVELNDKLGTEFNRVLDNWKGEVARMPELIDSSVANFMISRGQAPTPPSNGGSEYVETTPEVIPEPLPPPGPTSFLTNLMNQIDWGQVMMNIVAKQGGGDINSAIVNIITGKMGKSSGEPAQAKYISRGYSQAQSALRMKGIDRVSQAKSLQSAATLMLGQKLAADERGRQIGIKSYVDTFLEGLSRSPDTPQITP